MSYKTVHRFFSREFRFGAMSFRLDWQGDRGWITAFTRRFLTNAPVVVGPMELTKAHAKAIAEAFLYLYESLPEKKIRDERHLQSR